MTDELTKKIQTLALNDDAEGIYHLLMSWELRNPDWALMVRSKISAPSTTPQQKASLKSLLELWQSDSGMSEQQLDQHFEEKINKLVERDNEKKAVFSLKAHYENYTRTLNRIQSTSTSLEQNQKQQWIEIVRRLRLEDEFKEKLQRDHHQYLLSHDPEGTDPDFDLYIQDIKFLFSKLDEVATNTQIDTLTEIVGMPLPDDLVNFYLNMGGLHGDLFNGYLNLKLFAPSTLIESRNSEHPRNKLHGINLYDMIQYSWSNDRPELLVENGFPRSIVEALKKPLCIGWFTDGYLESHAYIINTSENQFGIFYWHQDDTLESDSLASVNSYSLSDLFTKVISELDKTIGKSLHDLSVDELDDVFEDVDIDCYLLDSLLNS